MREYLAERYRPQEVDEQPVKRPKYGTTEDEVGDLSLVKALPEVEEDDDFYTGSLFEDEDSLVWDTTGKATSNAVNDAASDVVAGSGNSWAWKALRKSPVVSLLIAGTFSRSSEGREDSDQTLKRQFRNSASVSARMVRRRMKRAGAPSSSTAAAGAASAAASATQTTGDYVRAASAATKKKSAAALVKASGGLLLKVVLPVLLTIFVIAMISGAISSVFTLKTDPLELSKVYAYITELDATKTADLHNAAAAAEAELQAKAAALAAEAEASGTDYDPIDTTLHFYVNGYPSTATASDIEFMTNIEYMLMYLDARYQDYTLLTTIDSTFGGSNVRDEIEIIHSRLYSFSISENRVDITMTALPAFLSPYLTDEDNEYIQTLMDVGPYTAFQTLSSPFGEDNYFSAEDRWAYYAEDGEIKYRSGITLRSGTNSVFAAEEGTISAGGDQVIENTDDGTLTYGNLVLCRVAAGQAVSIGDPIGTVGANGLFFACDYSGQNVCPLFYLPGIAGVSGGGDSGDFVAIAASQVGNVGGQPYWSWYGFGSRVEWCACFVSWCADQAGLIASGNLPKFSVVDDGVSWFQQRGQWHRGSGYQAKPGDIIFFDWDGDNDPDHVGIVESCDASYVYTIEGNTSGDACRRKTYNIHSSQIYGYGLL